MDPLELSEPFSPKLSRTHYPWRVRQLQEFRAQPDPFQARQLLGTHSGMAAKNASVVGG